MYQAEHSAARSFPDGGIAVETRTATGSLSLRIIEQVLVAGHDLVVVTIDEDDQDQATINRLLGKCPVDPHAARLYFEPLGVTTRNDDWPRSAAGCRRSAWME